MEININDCEDETRKIRANKLPEGWYWIIYDDASGHLESPTGVSYFSFDWNTCEYMINEDDEHYHVFDYVDKFGEELTFKDFMNYAEEYMSKYIISISNNIRESECEELEDEFE